MWREDLGSEKVEDQKVFGFPALRSVTREIRRIPEQKGLCECAARCQSMAEGSSLPPLLSFGTYKIKGRAAYDAVLYALACGYRSIDTARCYNNEDEVGSAVLSSGIPRSELFITSKIAPWEMKSEEDSYVAILASLSALKMEYIDLMLIHWPGRAKTPIDSPLNKMARRESWRALKRAKSEGRVLNIGVSNFTIAHLQDLLDEDSPSSSLASVSSCLEPPAVNQVERHPLYQQSELMAFCRSRGIALQAYSPLGCADARVLAHPQLQETAAEARVSVAELLLLWQTQQDVPVVVKSVSRARIEGNLLCVTGARLLDERILQKIQAVGAAENLKCCWDPSSIL